MTTNTSEEPMEKRFDRAAQYSEMQRAIPGLDAMYRLVHALIASSRPLGGRLLIVGAGGGREIAALGSSELALDIVAIDPSAQNLDDARLVAERTGVFKKVEFFNAAVDQLQAQKPFDVATSLLVMHHIRDDGSKLAYLTAIRDRLVPGGVLVHADVSMDCVEDFGALQPVYLAHGGIIGVDHGALSLELEAIPNLPFVSSTRTRELFLEAGLVSPHEVFRSLWYRCWIVRKPDSNG